MNGHNNDYPPDLQTRDPPPFVESTLDCCVITTNRVRFRNGSIQICVNRIIVKNGQSAPFDRAGNLIKDIDKNDDSSIDSTSDDESQSEEEDSKNYTQQQNGIAYLINEDIRDAIFGRVMKGTVLRRSNENDIWTETTEECAIKEMPWERIRHGLDHMAENPRDEIAAMQHLMRFYSEEFAGQQVSATAAMRHTRIIMPLDFLYDHRNLYTVTPYCEGGELFELLGMERNFTEEQSKELLRGILEGLEWLQRANLTHKDISLENIMVDQNMTVIIDMGMCLRIPFPDVSANEAPQPAQRCLINSRPRCGKLYYMAPEVFDQRPFDGYAVDMWAVGVCLFMMLTGQAPWNRPSIQDPYFYHITNGNLDQLLNLSADAIDLLQQMLLLDPRDRLSLQQVRSHPWMR